VSDELLNTGESKPEEDMNTTPPNPTQSGATGGWSMPEPVFQKTSGYLPQGFEKNFPQDEVMNEAAVDAAVTDEPTTNAADAEADVAATPAGIEAADVEPQPDISDTHDVEVKIERDPEPSKNGGAMKVVFSLFGILVALGLVLIFIAVIYYLFLMPPPGSTL